MIKSGLNEHKFNAPNPRKRESLPGRKNLGFGLTPPLRESVFAAQRGANVDNL